MTDLSTHLEADKALAAAHAAMAALWPGRALALAPLKPLVKPLRATVFRVEGGPEPAVVKVWGPGNAARAAAQAARQAQVAPLMAEGRWRVPGVLAFDAARLALVMQDPGGQSLRGLLDGPARPGAPQACRSLSDAANGVSGIARGQENPVAERAVFDRADGPGHAPDAPDAPDGTVAALAGGWLAAFHALSLRPHPFRPAGHLTWAARLLEERRNGLRAGPDPEAFASAVAGLTPLAKAARGSAAFRCVTHRDMTLANLVAGPAGSVWGIDFENAREDEPLRDLFTLALDLCAQRVRAAERPATLLALRQGYGHEIASPAARLFLQRAFALGVWANTPAQPSRRQAARLEAARWIMDRDDPVI